MALAATRLIPMRKNKGKSIGACLHNHTSYVQNPDKTEQGELVSSYQCSPLTVDEEFLLTKRLYEQTTGRSQKSDVIAYQVRQSFKPGEVTPEEANRIGYEFAERFLKGKHAFIVATHTDRAHIHNHIIYNSTALDGTRKFKNFWLSTFAVQRLSNLICLEHQLSTIEYKPYRERQKRIVYPPKESNRDRLCGIIDTILAEKPGDYEAFLQKLEQQGYEVKRGKYTAVKGKGQKRFIRFRTLGTGYGEDEIKAVLEGKAKHQPYQKKPPKEQPFQLLVDIQGKMAEGKSVGYKKWATKFNLKEMSKTLLFLQEQKISSADELRERAAAATERYHAMGDSIKAAEARLTEIAVLKTHIINYAKTREVYAAYRKAGYSKGCGVLRTADQEESSLPGLPQGTERDARTGSCTEKRGTIFCRGKGHHRKSADPINEYRRGAFPVGRHPRRYFLVYIAAILFYEPIFTQPLSFGLCAAGAVEKFATDRAVSVVYSRDSIGISKINAAFLTGQQIDRIHIQQLLFTMFVCKPHNTQRLLLYHEPSNSSIDPCAKKVQAFS